MYQNRLFPAISGSEKHKSIIIVLHTLPKMCWRKDLQRKPTSTKTRCCWFYLCLCDSRLGRRVTRKNRGKGTWIEDYQNPNHSQEVHPECRAVDSPLFLKFSLGGLAYWAHCWVSTNADCFTPRKRHIVYQCCAFICLMWWMSCWQQKIQPGSADRRSSTPVIVIWQTLTLFERADFRKSCCVSWCNRVIMKPMRQSTSCLFGRLLG